MPKTVQVKIIAIERLLFDNAAAMNEWCAANMERAPWEVVGSNMLDIKVSQQTILCEGGM